MKSNDPTYQELSERVRELENELERLQGDRGDALKSSSTEEQLRSAKEAAVQSEEKFRTIFNMSQSMVCIADLDTATFKFINPAFYKILGYSEEELLTKPFLELIHPDDVIPTQIVIDEQLKQGIPVVVFENRYLRKNGEYCWLRWNSYPFPEKGITYAIAHDITDQKIVDEELRLKNEEYEGLNEELKQTNEELHYAKEKAEDTNRLKSKFLNNMSHEIRTPMNGIVGFSDLLVQPGVTEEKRNYYAKIVQNSSFQLLKIIDDLLEISTIETKQEIIEETPFCLNDLLMELYSIFKLKSNEKEISLYIKKALSNDQSHIISDKPKFSRILSNLLENAIKFTNKGYVEIGYHVEDGMLVIYIKDTGLGILPENQDLVFDRFSQEEKEISMKHGGLGLGLSISKENAQLLGGNITLESEKEKGSTFYVSIPYKPAQREESGITNGDIANRRNSGLKHKILVAEDEEVNYLYIEALFEDEYGVNYELIHARNGKEAVDVCAKVEKIDVVLMDVKMPVMNGHEAAKEIKTRYPYIPIIAQTAYSTEADKNLALASGCDEFISKPLDKSTLFELIRKYTEV